MVIQATDNRYRVSVDGQMDMPFNTEREALVFAEYMSGYGYDVSVYKSFVKVNQDATV